MNKICLWIVSNPPLSRRRSRFYPYAYVYEQAYGYRDSEGAGYQIREDLEPYVRQLASDYGIAVQLGAKSNGSRGIRLLSIK
jgi:hypothetical protein